MRPISGTTFEKLERVVIATPSNAQVPLGELAKISFSQAARR